MDDNDETPAKIREWDDARLLDHILLLELKVATQGRQAGTIRIDAMLQDARSTRLEILRRMQRSWKPTPQNVNRAKAREAIFQAIVTSMKPGGDNESWSEDLTDIVMNELSEIKVFWALEQWEAIQRMGPLV